MSPMNNRLMRPRASGGFTPKSISNLAAWYDISSTTDSSKVTTVDGAISALIDLSGNGKNAIQNQANNRPSAQTAVYNGKDVARFATASPADFLTASGLTFSTTGFTAFFAIARASALPYQCPFGEGAAAGGGNCAGLGIGANNLGSHIYTIFRIGAAVASGGVASTLNALQIVSAIGAGVDAGGVFAATTYRINRGTVGTTGAAASVVTNPDRVFIGAASSGQTDPFGGDIGEIILYSRQLTTPERQSVEEYLSKKWGVTLT